VHIHRFLVVSAFCLISPGILTSCAGARFNWDSAGYTVKRGDTLYSISWRYEIDHEDLARWNQLSSPYIIHPGDRLRTRAVVSDRGGNKPSVESKGYPLASQQKKAGPGQNQIRVRDGDTLYSLASQHYMPAWKLAMINRIKEPYVLHTGQILSLSGRPKSAPAATTALAPAPATAKAGSKKWQPANTKLQWHWPVRGKIISKFNRWKNDSKGIDIAGKKGTSIRAAAAGKVVYSGNSLIHYGHLVIIKHSRDYLSAYANNRRLLVSEGALVKAGQKIAELGDASAKSPHLHFEIRKKGKPVDPLRYLPSS
jgi:lipoprotein NlpD